MARKSPASADTGKTAPNRWSQRVTRESNALDLEPGVFTMAPKEMAESLERSAEASTRRKTTPFRSAMSMLVFYQNRAGRTLSANARKNIELAKDELRRLYGKPTKSSK